MNIENKFDTIKSFVENKRIDDANKMIHEMREHINKTCEKMKEEIKITKKDNDNLSENTYIKNMNTIEKIKTKIENSDDILFKAKQLKKMEKLLKLCEIYDNEKELEIVY